MMVVNNFLGMNLNNIFKLRRKFFSFVATLGLVFSFVIPVAFAGNIDCNSSLQAPQFSLLPFTEKNSDECKVLLNQVEVADEDTLSASMKICRNDVLGCGIKTGRIGFWMVPYFVTYLINFLLGLSGLICVLFIVIGGYRYVVGGLTEDKEKGKHTIRDALMGMGIALLAWTIVNVIINAVTG